MIVSFNFEFKGAAVYFQSCIRLALFFHSYNYHIELDFWSDN